MIGYKKNEIKNNMNDYTILQAINQKINDKE